MKTVIELKSKSEQTQKAHLWFAVEVSRKIGSAFIAIGTVVKVLIGGRGEELGQIMVGRRRGG